MKNNGKVFEEDFKKSISDTQLYIRIPDPPQSFIKNANTKFSRKNPCDCFVFDGEYGILYALELKTTKAKSMSFENIFEEEPAQKMIHKHQIIGLAEFSKYKSVISGFIFNFRDESNNTQTSYYQNIKDFITMTKSLSKCSFNVGDLLNYNGIEIYGIKKRVRYTWDTEKLFKKIK